MRRPTSAFFAFLFVLACALPQTGAQVQPEFKSDGKGTYDVVTKEVVYTDHAQLTLGETVLLADEIRYNRATGLARATGHVDLRAGARRLLADAGTYNIRTKELSVTRLRLGEYPVYVTGDTLVADRAGVLTFTNATVFFREIDATAPTLHARKLTYDRGRFIAGEDVQIVLFKYGLPLLRFRHFRHNLDHSLLSHVNTTVGYRGSVGAFAELGLHVPLASGIDAGADVGLYSERGVMAGPAGSYQGTTEGNLYAGSLRSGIIDDGGTLGTDALGRAVPSERSYLAWWHRQQVGDRLSFAGQFNYWSDSEVLRDFRPKDFVNVQQPDSYFEGAYSGDNYVVSAFARVQPNRYHQVQQRLPEVRFDLQPTAVGGGFLHRLETSYAALQENATSPSSRLRTDRLDAYYSLERPIAPTDWLAFTPVAGGRITYYSDPLGRDDAYTRTIGELGFDARLRAAGTFDLKNEIWEIDGLRHLVEPRLSYRYAPEADTGRRYIPSIDRQTFSTYLQPLSIGDQRNVDELDSLHTLRIALGNVLQTRAKGYGSRDLASLDLAADYRFDPEAGDRPWSAIHTELTLTPASWLRVEVYNRFSPQNLTLREWNTGFEIVDGQWWALRLSTHYLQHDFEDYYLEYRRRLSDTYDAVARWRFDAHGHRMTEQTYGLTQQIGQSWSVKYELSFSEGASRESSFGFNVEVNFLQF